MEIDDVAFDPPLAKNTFAPQSVHCLKTDIVALQYEILNVIVNVNEILNVIVIVNEIVIVNVNSWTNLILKLQNN
jgi:hypothetical protein